mmetsp:Transcript_11783/g.37389  ORF Transcript_11783/g.37389 Transcript_11783/m.37389 type:complete len:334 (-) Transcript_11783:132-1133(-)
MNVHTNDGTLIWNVILDNLKGNPPIVVPAVTTLTVQEHAFLTSTPPAPPYTPASLTVPSSAQQSIIDLSRIPLSVTVGEEPSGRTVLMNCIRQGDDTALGNAPLLVHLLHIALACATRGHLDQATRPFVIRQFLLSTDAMGVTPCHYAAAQRPLQGSDGGDVAQLLVTLAKELDEDETTDSAQDDGGAVASVLAAQSRSGETPLHWLASLGAARQLVPAARSLSARRSSRGLAPLLLTPSGSRQQIPVEAVTERERERARSQRSTTATDSLLAYLAAETEDERRAEAAREHQRATAKRTVPSVTPTVQVQRRVTSTTAGGGAKKKRGVIKLKS